MTRTESKPWSESMPKSSNRINVKVTGFVYTSLSKLINSSHKIFRKSIKKKEIRNE